MAFWMGVDSLLLDSIISGSDKVSASDIVASGASKPSESLLACLKGRLTSPSSG